ncbi:MAG: MEKHLA domain-containing protein, partial [Proteobacteria bacterium]|nr:MEKHLA domain-containing protein [Pseudomonadota bacterium]
AIVWNISDAHGTYCGQAAAFDTWEFMPPQFKVI